MIRVINGIEYISLDFSGKPVNYVASKNINNCDPVIRIEETVDGVPVLSIGDGIFARCVYLQKIELPDSLVRVGASAFYKCTSLEHVSFYKSHAQNSNTSISIGGEAFWGCSSLKNIESQKPLHLNGQMIFYDCVSLTSLGTNNMIVGGIYAMDFYNCKSLKSIHIRSKYCKLWTDCFHKADNIVDVYFECETVKAPKSVIQKLKRKNIYCKPSCNLMDLTYDGVNVKVI